MAIEWTDTPSSSQIKRVGFDAETSKGYCGFLDHRTGEEASVYEYDGCTREEADAIINSDSAGRQFAATWKYGKAYRKL
jgi:hypothetical protein